MRIFRNFIAIVFRILSVFSCNAMKKKASAPSFEERLARLEEIVATLDRGERPLEELVHLYEEGIALSRECADFLRQTEQKVHIIQQNSANEAPRADEEGSY